MYATGLPIVIFITGDKIDREIDVGHCHFILDSALTWDTFCRDHPVAFCVGCTDEERDTHIGAFKRLGFETLEQQHHIPITTFIARNRKFIEVFERTVTPKAKGQAG
jgi:hypothetical protein